MAVTKTEGIELLKKLKEQLGKTTEKAEAIGILTIAGKTVGYAPAFRALVMNVEPEKAIKWQ